jgi:putative acetyltransferase
LSSPAPSTIIRRELPGDEDAIFGVHASAFAVHYPGGEPVEPGLVTALRASGAWIPALSLVAVRDGALVGHVCCTRATLGEQHLPVLGLGPLGVLEEHKGSGVGSALVHAVLAAADALDEPLVVLLGHPGYYPRFGFRPASELGIRPEVADWEPAFQARPLTAHRPEMTGLFAYAAPFGEL